MNVKRYIKYQLKGWLPLIIVFSALVIFVSVMSGLASRPQILTVSSDGYAPYGMTSTPESALIGLLVPSFIAAFVMPFFAFSHRYGKVRADTYLCLPTKDGEVTRLRVVLSLLILLAIFSVAYLIGSVVAIANQFQVIERLRNELNYSAENGSYYTSTITLNHGGYYFAVWPLACIALALVYLFNCFLVSRANNVLQGIIALISGNLVACFFLFVMMLDLEILGVHIYTEPNRLLLADNGILVSGGFFIPIALIYWLFNALICGQSLKGNLALTGQALAGLLLFLFLDVGMAVWLFLGKEVKGEDVSSKKPRGVLGMLLPHLLFTMVLSLVSGVSGLYVSFLGIGNVGLMTGSTILGGILELVWYSAFYYVLLGLYNHNFKLDKTNWIIFGCNEAFALLMLFLGVFYLSNRMGTLYYD